MSSSQPSTGSSAPVLSLILCSRNDHYMGNSVWRLETTLNFLGDRVRTLGRQDDVEVIVSDWGSDVPLREAIALRPAAARIVSFVTVPPPLARELQGDSPFPEVLALNAAARRASGRYIGRIDQDTLVGEHFLRWWFELIDGVRSVDVPGASPETALFFANRRDIPYRFAADLPSLANVTRFVRLFGRTRPVWSENPATGDVFWTSSVGIWLAHRTLWYECGGYDERLIYYNWMETDMICRLRQKYPVVNLGELTSQGFYHLEHCHPRTAWFARRHEVKNAEIDLATPPLLFHPNADTWGLRDCELAPEPSAAVAVIHDAAIHRWTEGPAFTLAMLRLVASTIADRAFIGWTAERQVFDKRIRRVGRELAGQSVWQWPGRLLTLWTGRQAARNGRSVSLRAGRLRTALARTLSRLGLLASARRMRLRIGLATSREILRRAREDRERFSRFQKEYCAAVEPKLDAAARAQMKTALVVSSRCPTVEAELGTIEALQRAGFRPVVLLEDERRALRPYYELAGVDEIHLWSELLTSLDYSSKAAEVVGRCESIVDLSRYTHAGVRVGMIAVCTALRRLRVGALDLRLPRARERLTRSVAASLESVAEARSILRSVRPELVLTDTEYTPKGELFDTCLENGLEVITYDTSHRSNALMFKRYGRHNRNDHLTTLSASSWALVRRLEWTSARRDRLAGEIATSYEAGDWFGTLPAPPTRPMKPAELRARLGLDPARKTAFIFPHMLWDAPMMWGRPLFSTYQEWFLETVAAACRNRYVNWVVKIHPGHVRKQVDEGYQGGPAEMRLLQARFGTLPPHVVVVPPNTPVTTLSLFDIMDYCLTVRGTVGVEAARLGIPVLTAGPARYSERGFTVDSASREDYLAKLDRIQNIPALSDEQRELAERFAYGLFLMRPVTLESIASDPGTLSAWFQSHDEDLLAGVA